VRRRLPASNGDPAVDSCVCHAYGMPPLLDGTDRALCAALMTDARRTIADLATEVSLSPTSVKRRIARLEREGVILGYTATIDLAALGWIISAFVELRFSGKTTPDVMDRATSRIPEVSAIYTTAGDHDVIALVRARNVDHLREVIHRLRATTSIVSTRTHLILQTNVSDERRLVTA
jgi:Lrp/AsnC family leucine-responsive transcriptional regulator